LQALEKPAIKGLPKAGKVGKSKNPPFGFYKIGEREGHH
jgi:hypothetical protein